MTNNKPTYRKVLEIIDIHGRAMAGLVRALLSGRPQPLTSDSSSSASSSSSSST